MRVREMIEMLQRFDPESPVSLCVAMPEYVVQCFDGLWVGDSGDGPRIQAAGRYVVFSIYVGCAAEQLARPLYGRRLAIDLGDYEDPADADRVEDFYVHHAGLSLPLHHPDFDYEDWIPPRMKSGEYNRYVAEILRRRLSRDA